MMNSQQEQASKDCRVCNRRRIKCDRRLPMCAKCEKRGLKCSGYGVILKWDQGIASRGKLKGKSLPINMANLSVSATAVFNESNSPERQSRLSDDQLQRITTLFRREFRAIPKPLLYSQVQSSEERRLLYHYDHIVASNMAWADCLENPWRHIIIPLALESPPLLNAILAFAAKHMNAISFSTSNENTSIIPVSFPGRFQQQAVTLLAREIQDFATEKHSGNSVETGRNLSGNRSNAILATMLVLCNVETVWPDSSVWEVHLNAARTVMVSHKETTLTKSPEDSTAAFLEQELFIANTFASTTNFLNFTPNEDFKLKKTISKPSSIFIEFLNLLQMVTSLERQATANPTALANSGVSLSGLRKLFEHARSRTLEMDTTFQVFGSHDHLHLSRTVNCFYYAGLIYSYRALCKDERLDPDLLIEKQTQIKISKNELFRTLSFAETNKPTFAQDLVWPLFIAGTEATQENEQRLVIAKLDQSMMETGFSNCQHALKFLNALWQRKNNMPENELDWIAFAREWTGQGKTFLVF